MPSACILCGHLTESETSKKELPQRPILLQKCLQCNKEPCAPCRELIKVERRIHDARVNLKHLLEEQSQLAHNTNLSKDALFARLPVEVACRIFAFCVDLPNLLPHGQGIVLGRDSFDYSMPPTRAPFHLTLGAVCSAWRRILWSYPRFWMEVPVFVEEYHPLSRITLFEEWLGRSGQSLLIVRMWFDRELDGVWDIKAELEFISLLNSVAHRWSFFSARMPGIYIERLRFQPKENTRLQGLILESPFLEARQKGRLPGLGGASPAIVKLTRIRPANLQIEWDNLIYFHGNYLNVAECVGVLRSAPRLLQCTLSGVAGIGGSSGPPVVNTSLKNISVSTHASIFKHLTLPSLQEIDCGLDGDSLGEALSEFVIRSRCALTVALIYGSSGDDIDLLDFLLLTPSLQQLTLQNVEIGERFLRQLGATSFTSALDDSPHLLPNLQKFHYDEIERVFPWSSVAAMSPTQFPPSNMTRRPLNNIYFDIFAPHRLPDPLPELWPKGWDQLISRDDLAQIQAIIDTGVNLQIRYDSMYDIIQVSKDYYKSLDEAAAGV